MIAAMIKTSDLQATGREERQERPGTEGLSRAGSGKARSRTSMQLRAPEHPQQGQVRAAQPQHITHQGHPSAECRSSLQVLGRDVPDPGLVCCIVDLQVLCLV